MLEHVNRRFFYGFLIVSGFAACSYDAPTVGDVTASASSSSSSGMAGMGGAGQSSSSSQGNGGFGLFPMGGMGGIGVGGIGVGGNGGIPETTVATSSSSSSGAPMDPVVQNCGGGDCPTSPATTVCCKQKAAGGTSYCEKTTGVCVTGYALKCDDKADCGLDEFCCMSGFDRATCSTDCMTSIVCKTKLDCPVDQECIVPAGSLMYCGTP